MGEGVRGGRGSWSVVGRCSHVRRTRCRVLSVDLVPTQSSGGLYGSRLTQQLCSWLRISPQSCRGDHGRDSRVTIKTSSGEEGMFSLRFPFASLERSFSFWLINIVLCVTMLMTTYLSKRVYVLFVPCCYNIVNDFQSFQLFFAAINCSIGQ